MGLTHTPWLNFPECPIAPSLESSETLHILFPANCRSNTSLWMKFMTNGECCHVPGGLCNIDSPLSGSKPATTVGRRVPFRKDLQNFIFILKDSTTSLKPFSSGSISPQGFYLSSFMVRSEEGLLPQAQQSNRSSPNSSSGSVEGFASLLTVPEGNTSCHSGHKSKLCHISAHRLSIHWDSSRIKFIMLLDFHSNSLACVCIQGPVLKLKAHLLYKLGKFLCLLLLYFSSSGLLKYL